MILTQIIITFLPTTLLFLWGQTTRTHWKEQNKKQEIPTAKKLKTEEKTGNETSYWP